MLSERDARMLRAQADRMHLVACWHELDSFMSAGVNVYRPMPGQKPEGIWRAQRLPPDIARNRSRTCTQLASNALREAAGGPKYTSGYGVEQIQLAKNLVRSAVHGISEPGWA